MKKIWKKTVSYLMLATLVIGVFYGNSITGKASTKKKIYKEKNVKTINIDKAKDISEYYYKPYKGYYKHKDGYKKTKKGYVRYNNYYYYKTFNYTIKSAEKQIKKVTVGGKNLKVKKNEAVVKINNENKNRVYNIVVTLKNEQMKIIQVYMDKSKPTTSDIIDGDTYNVFDEPKTVTFKDNYKIKTVSVSSGAGVVTYPVKSKTATFTLTQAGSYRFVAIDYAKNITQISIRVLSEANQLEAGYLEDALVSTTTATPSASTDNSQTTSVPTPSGITPTTPKTDITSVFHSTPQPTAYSEEIPYKEAVYIKGDGKSFNLAMKKISGSNKGLTEHDDKIVAMVFTGTPPTEDMKVYDLSDKEKCDSYLLVWKGTDNRIYFYSDAKKAYLPEDSSYMFAGITMTTTGTEYSENVITFLRHFDSKNVTNMSHMFEDAQFYINGDFPHFDTSKVTDMSYMFYHAHLNSFSNFYSRVNGAGGVRKDLKLSPYADSIYAKRYPTYQYKGKKYGTTNKVYDCLYDIDPIACYGYENQSFFGDEIIVVDALSPYDYSDNPCLAINFDTRNVTKFACMFQGLGYVEITLYGGNFDVSKAEDVYYELKHGEYSSELERKFNEYVFKGYSEYYDLVNSIFDKNVLWQGTDDKAYGWPCSYYSLGGKVRVEGKNAWASFRELYAKETVNGIPTAQYIIKNTVFCSEYMNNTFTLG